MWIVDLLKNIRIKASLIHLSISGFVAIFIAFLLFKIWYPYPYQEISGGQELFLLFVFVDIFLGPLMTLVVFNRLKSPKQMRFDLFVIATIQFAGLAYGLWTIAAARPVHMVFEIDRFRIVHAIEVPIELITQTSSDINPLPCMGPTLLGLRSFKNKEEEIKLTIAALQGIPLASRPDLWQFYEASRIEVLQAIKPAVQLKMRFPGQAATIDSLLEKRNLSINNIGYLPLVGRKLFWTILLDNRNADILGYLPVDSF